jgi:hypothetical protein
MFLLSHGFPSQVGRILDTAIDFLSNVVPSMVPSFLQGAVHGCETMVNYG